MECQISPIFTKKDQLYNFVLTQLGSYFHYFWTIIHYVSDRNDDINKNKLNRLKTQLIWERKLKKKVELCKHLHQCTGNFLVKLWLTVLVHTGVSLGSYTHISHPVLPSKGSGLDQN